MSQMKPITDVKQLVEQTNLSNSEATVAWDAAKRREDCGEKQQLIIVLDEWATYSKYDIVDERVVVAGYCESVTDDAYYVKSAAEVDTSQQNAKWLTSVVSTIDKTDTDHVDDRGETYVPKSAVNGLFVVKGE